MEPILIWIMGVRMTVEVMSRGVFYSILIMSILKGVRTHVTMKRGTYSIFLFIVHEGGNGVALVGMGPGLLSNMDGGTSNPKMVGGTRNGVE